MRYELHLEWKSTKTGRRITTVTDVECREHEAREALRSVEALGLGDGNLILLRSPSGSIRLEPQDVAIRFTFDQYSEVDMATAVEWLLAGDDFQCTYRSLLPTLSQAYQKARQN